MSRLVAVVFWTAAGSMHFVRPQFYEPIVPPPLDRWKKEVVAVSGAAELIGAATIALPRTRRFARAWLLATLVAVYPANIYMALRPERFKQIPKELLWARLPVQGIFAWLTWRATE